MKISFAVVLLAGIVYTAAFPIDQEQTPFFRVGDDTTGAVASESSICTQIGIDLLRAGVCALLLF